MPVRRRHAAAPQLVALQPAPPRAAALAAAPTTLCSASYNSSIALSSLGLVSRRARGPTRWSAFFACYAHSRATPAAAMAAAGAAAAAAVVIAMVAALALVLGLALVRAMVALVRAMMAMTGIMAAVQTAAVTPGAGARVRSRT